MAIYYNNQFRNYYLGATGSLGKMYYGGVEVNPGQSASLGPVLPITSGLQLYWDPGNISSWPGSGTTVYDLSGNNNNGTLVNNILYTSSNQGVFTWAANPVNKNYIYSTGSQVNLTGSNYTVMGAARYINFTTSGRVISSYNNWLVGQWSTGTTSYYAEGNISLNSTVNDNNWRIYTANGINGGNYQLYVNNVLNAQSTSGTQGPKGIQIGSWGNNNEEFSTGQLGFLLVYNRVLTTEEMTQNYNYFKDRYGL